MGYVQIPNEEKQAAAAADTAVQNATPHAQRQKWSTGLFSVFSAPGGGALGCVSLLMPCVQYGVLLEHMPQESRLCAAGDFCTATGWFLALDVLAASAGCLVCPGVSIVPTSAIMHSRVRRHLRDKYNIEGGTWSDLCTSWWCGPCALAQETREVLIRSAADQQRAAEASGASAMVPPGPTHMYGNLLLPLSPKAEAAATGVPVPHVPPTTVATVNVKGDVPSKADAM